MARKSLPKIEGVGSGANGEFVNATGTKGQSAKKIPARVMNEAKYTVPVSRYAYLDVEVVGETSLILHRFSEKAKLEMRASQEKNEEVDGKRKLEPRDPDAEFEAAKNVDAEGRECIPGSHFYNAMLSAVSTLGRQVSQSAVKIAVRVLPELIPITGVASVRRDDPCRIGGWRDPVTTMRYRPEYAAGWKVVIPVRLCVDMISPQQFIALIARAGELCGVGEWRPTSGKGGSHGLFKVVSVSDHAG